MGKSTNLLRDSLSSGSSPEKEVNISTLSVTRRHTFWEVNVSYKLPADRKNVVFSILRERFRRWGVKRQSRQSGSSLLTGCLLRQERRGRSEWSHLNVNIQVAREENYNEKLWVLMPPECGCIWFVDEFFFFQRERVVWTCLLISVAYHVIRVTKFEKLICPTWFYEEQHFVLVVSDGIVNESWVVLLQCVS